MTLSFRENLDRAIGLHLGGRIEDAADIYSGLVADAPACFDAHHLHGMARLQQGRSRDAAAHLLRALEIEPANPAALNHLGVTLERLGQTDPASGLGRSGGDRDAG